jgi:hypothetical protein
MNKKTIITALLAIILGTITASAHLGTEKCTLNTKYKDHLIDKTATIIL